MPVKGLLASETQSLEVAELQKLVCKTFWSATYMGIPSMLLQDAQFTGWMTCLLEAVQRPVPQVSTAAYLGPEKFSAGYHILS